MLDKIWILLVINPAIYFLYLATLKRRFKKEKLENYYVKRRIYIHKCNYSIARNITMTIQGIIVAIIAYNNPNLGLSILPSLVPYLIASTEIKEMIKKENFREVFENLKEFLKENEEGELFDRGKYIRFEKETKTIGFDAYITYFRDSISVREYCNERIIDFRKFDEYLNTKKQKKFKGEITKKWKLVEY